MNKTDFLVQQPSFLNGMARSIDLFADFTDYNSSLSEIEADQLALKTDWEAVLGDLWDAYLNAREERGKEAEQVTA